MPKSSPSVTELQTQLERYEYILEGAGLGSWDWWLETDKVHFDSRWCKMLGLDWSQTPQDLSTWDSRVHPDDKAKAYADIKAYLEGKTPCYENIHRMQHANGKWVWILDRGRISEVDSRGKPIRFTGTHFDITDYKEKELLSEMIQKISGVGGWEYDVLTHKTRWSEQTYRIHNIHPSVPTNPEMGIRFYAPHEQERISKCFKECLNGLPYKEKFEFIDAKGKTKWVEAFGEPIKNANGEIFKIIGTFQDITESKEKELAMFNAKLEIQNANERMAAILNYAPIVSYECLLDKDWTMNYISPYIEELCGFPASDFLNNKNRTFESIIYNNDREEVALSIQNAVKRNEIYRIKYRIIHKNGSIRWLEETGRVSQKTGNLVGVVMDITDQEKYQNDLDNIFKNSLDMMCIANHDGYFLRVSPSFSKVLGYTEEELLCQPYLNFVVKDDQYKTSGEAQKNASGGDTIQFENRYRCKNGEIKIMSWNARPDSKTGLIYAIVRDVTEIRNKEHRNQQILEALMRAWIVSETDASGKIISANHNFSQISQYTEQELIGKDHRILNSGVHSKEFFKELWSKLSNGEFWEGQIENKRKNGEHYFVNTVITPVYDMVTKQIKSYFSIRQDITSAVKNQQILEQAEIAGKFGSFILNLKTKKGEWSKGHNAVMGFSDRTEPKFEEILKIVVTEDIPILLNELEKVATGKIKEYRIKYRIFDSTHSLKYIESFGRVSFNLKNEPEFVVGIVRDITEQSLLEKKHEEQRLQMIHTSKLAALGEMAAGVAHEINNPLTIITASTQLLHKFKHDIEKYDSKVKTIQQSAQRIAKIVSGLKKFSRSSSGTQFKIEKLNTILEEVLTLTESKLKTWSIKLTLDIQDNISILCDQVELEQVIINMINNAADAVKNQTERWIKLQAFEKNQEIIIQIIDSGSGITPEVEQKLFQPFFTTKAVGEGTGLGLAICKGILDNHKAKVHLNKLYKNTCFEIQFPKVEHFTSQKTA